MFLCYSLARVQLLCWNIFHFVAGLVKFHLQRIWSVEYELSSALCNGHGNPFLPLPLFSSALLVLCCLFASLETNTTWQGFSGFWGFFCSGCSVLCADLSICWFKSFTDLVLVTSLVQRGVNTLLLSAVTYSLRLKCEWSIPKKNACWMQLSRHNTLLPLTMFVSVSRCHFAKSQELKSPFSSTILQLLAGDQLHSFLKAQV